MRTSLKTALGVSAAGLLASVAFPAAANAATAGTVTIRSCNHSSTDEYVGFPYRGGLSSTIINPGKCWQGSLGKAGNPDEAVGYKRVNGQWLAVADKFFSNASGTVEFDF